MNAQPTTLAAATIEDDAPIYVREAYDTIEDLVAEADADYVILRNAFEVGTDAMVVTFGEPWTLLRRKQIREEMQSHWGGEFDRWAVTVDVQVLPWFGRCLVLAMVGGMEHHR